MHPYQFTSASTMLSLLLLAACSSGAVGGAGGADLTAVTSVAASTSSVGYGGGSGVGGGGGATVGQGGAAGGGQGGAPTSSSSSGVGGAGGGGPCDWAECAEGVVVVPNMQFAWGLAIDATNLYWSDFDAGTVGSVSLAGGAPTVLWSMTGFGNMLAVDDTNLYWAGACPGHVEKSPLGGGARQTLVYSVDCVQMDGAQDLLSDATNLYWPDYGNGFISSVPKDGGALTMLASGQSARAIAMAGNALFWGNDDGTLMRLDLPGGAPAVFAAEEGGLYGVAADEDFVYWANTAAGTLSRAPIAGGPAVLLVAGLKSPHRVVVRGGFVYWTEAGSDPMRVWRLPISGGAVPFPLTPLNGPNFIADFAVDDEHLYCSWTEILGEVDIRRFPLCCAP